MIVRPEVRARPRISLKATPGPSRFHRVAMTRGLLSQLQERSGFPTSMTANSELGELQGWDVQESALCPKAIDAAIQFEIGTYAEVAVIDLLIIPDLLEHAFHPSGLETEDIAAVVFLP